jgi:hypothetical protein
MKTRTVKFQRALGFSALSIGLLATATSFGQLIEIEDSVAQNLNTATTEAAEATEAYVQPEALTSGASNQGLQTQPVAISTSMAPRVAPQALPAEIGAPSTGIGGNNPGNANTGGVQVQSVNVTAVQDQTTANGRADIIRRERMRRELENETRLIEKVEEGRLDDETRRAKVIEDFSSKNQVEADTSMLTPVQPVITLNPYAAPAVTEVTRSVSRDNKKSSFNINPFGGYRWYNRQDFYALDPDNLFTTGVAIEGRVNDYIGIEGNFTFAHDRFQARNMIMGGGPMVGGPVVGGAAVGSPMYLGGHSAVGGNQVYGNVAGGGGGCGGMYSAAACNFRTRDSYEISAAAKLGLPMGSVRPFALAGVGGVYSNYNIDNAYTTAYANNIGWVRNTQHFMGVFGGGLDLNMSSNMSVGARFDYQSVMGGENTEMHRIYGSAADRYQLTGNLSVKF